MNNLNRYKPSFITMNSEEHYKGKSFNYVGEWRSGIHYVNDQYVQDFVTYKGSLLACQKSNTSNCDNEPQITFNNDQVIVKSIYWDLVLPGIIKSENDNSNISELISNLLKTTSIKYVDGNIVYSFGDEELSKFNANKLTKEVNDRLTLISTQLTKDIEAVKKENLLTKEEIIGNIDDNMEKNSIFGVRKYIDYRLSWDTFE